VKFIEKANNGPLTKLAKLHRAACILMGLTFLLRPERVINGPELLSGVHLTKTK
jgi:hypothetical protein